MTPPTPAERLRAACVESCERHAKARARDVRDSDHAGEINTARNHKRLYEYMGVTLAALPLPEPTPLEAARERFVDAWTVHFHSQRAWREAGRPESGFVSDSHWSAIDKKQVAEEALRALEGGGDV